MFFCNCRRWDFNTEPEIKQMPEYDPDAELSSLNLTIPMWIRSMKRSVSIINFKEASTNARKKLSDTLTDLKDAADELEEKLKENTYEQ